MSQSITVNANATQAVNVSGKFLNIIACTAAFKVELDGGGQKTGIAGATFAAATSEGFKRIVFTETSGADNKITFEAGDSPQAGRSTVVSANSATVAGDGSSWYDFGTAAGLSQGKVTFIGHDPVTGLTRKTLIVTNLGFTVQGGAASVNLIVGFVGGQTTQPAFAVFPGQTLTIETNDDLILWSMNQNLNGAPTHLMGAVYEIFYLKPLQTDQ